MSDDKIFELTPEGKLTFDIKAMPEMALLIDAMPNALVPASPFEGHSMLLEADATLPLELPGATNVQALVGPPGPAGGPGKPGERGYRGYAGNPGTSGSNGKSAYELWLEAGNTGTLEDFFRSTGSQAALDYLNLLIEQAAQQIKNSFQGTIDENTARLVALQQYLDAQIYASRREILNSATQLGQQLAAESLDRADAILAERVRWEAGVESESYARNDALQSATADIKSYTSGYVGFSAIKAWDFSTDSAGWVDTSGAPITVVSSPNTNDDGWAYGSNENNPSLVSPAGLVNITSKTASMVKIQVRKVGSPVWAGIFQWRANGESWSNAKQVTVGEPQFNSAGEATVSFAVPNWNGSVYQIRFLLQSTPSSAANRYTYRYVALGNTLPSASTGLVYQEIKTVSDNLGAEASQRNLLAAQMRGNYTGTDVNQVTQGLLFNERTVRAQADQANSNDILVLQSRLSTGDVAQAISATQTKIQQVDNRVSAEANRLDQVSLKTNNNTASATQLLQVTQDLNDRVAAKITNTLDVNGNISGTVSENNGVTSMFSILAQVFRVVNSAAAGLEMTNGYMRVYTQDMQYIIGSGFANGYSMWFGPNVGINNCTDASAISYAKVNGEMLTTGKITGSLLSASALELGSTRIHTGGGRLAPFTLRDSSYRSLGHDEDSLTQTIDGFVSPSYGSGYHAKRFAAQRMDVYLDVNVSGNRGEETCSVEVQYNSGAWQTIATTTMDCDYRGSFPMLVRYTTADTWDTVAFRARTSQRHTQALAFRVEVLNYNESANPPGNNSGVNGTGSGSGTLPNDPDPWCVDYDTTVLPDGRFVRDLKVGDMVECVDVRTGHRSWEKLRAMGIGFEDCYRISTAHAEIIQSKSTPMDMRDGSVVRTPYLAGHELLTHAHDWEVAQVAFVGLRKVCKPDFGNRMFFAGTTKDGTLATHNVRAK